MIFLDACAVIYWVEMVEPQYSRFVMKLRSLRDQYGALPFAISHLSLLECRVKPLRDNDDETLKRYQQFFSAQNLVQIALTPILIEMATMLRARYRLATPDALQAASALSIASSESETLFLTNDAVFKKIPALHVITL